MTSDASASASASVKEPPPAGRYKLAVEERSGTCPQVAPSPMRAAWPQMFFVHVRRGKDGARVVNVPVSISAGYAVVRIDLKPERGAKGTYSSTRHECAHEAKTNVEVTSISATAFTMNVTSDYTDAAGCSSHTPPVFSSCHRESVLTYTLEEAVCPSARCLSESAAAPDGGTHFVCKECDDP